MSVESYFDRRAQGYSRKCKKGIWGWIKNRECLLVERLLSPRKGSSILDLGCGDGFYSIYFKNKFSCDVLAVDSSENMLASLKAIDFSIICRKEDCSKLSATGSYDKILAAGLLEFIDPLDTFLQGCLVNLSLTGDIVFLVPRAGVYGFFYKCIHNLLGCPVHLRSEKEYISLFSKHGFKTVQVEKLFPMSMVFKLNYK